MQKPVFDIETYVRQLITPMLDNPHSAIVKSTPSEGGGSTTIEVFVASADYGKVVGRKGQNFKAMSTLLSTAAWKNGTTYILRVDHANAEKPSDSSKGVG